jgi:predicted AlkP superfamily pyrophosphatase or phosphodiesterase
MKTKILHTLILSLSIAFSFAQAPKPQQSPPKLVVGIVVDQMRYDYIYKYWSKFGSDGFKRLVNEGFSCKNTNFNYVPTYTGPGHASIYTGATPAIHGIVANDWYIGNGKEMYCSYDGSVKSVGTANTAGHMSPRNMLATSIADELRLSNGKRSKVIGIALKDRGAILPAGHTANAAYWFDPATGNWISSTHYISELPQWVIDFNKKELAKKYLSSPWKTLLPIEQYTESWPDNSPYEKKFVGEAEPVFPHDLPALMEKNGGLGLIRYTPFGNTLTKDFALDAIRAENLGKGKHTDMIAISFSSTDYIGHKVGIHAIELEDAYLRLDKDIAELLKFLDTWTGKGNTLVFLTADHGAVDVPAYLQDSKVPAGYLNPYGVLDSLKRGFVKAYGDSLIEYYTNHQVYLNDNAIAAKGLSKTEIENIVGTSLMKVKGVAGFVTSTILQNTYFPEGIRHRLQMGYYGKRSGDVLLHLDPAWVEYERTGTTHGAPYTYDTHIPLLWYGWNIKSGSSVEPVDITDIAPTLAVFLNIPFPNGSMGQPIPFLTK